MHRTTGLKVAIAAAMASLGNTILGRALAPWEQKARTKRVVTELTRGKPNGGHARGATAKQKRAAIKRRNKAKNKRGSK